LSVGGLCPIAEAPMGADMEFRVDRWVQINDPGSNFDRRRGQIKELAGDHMILELWSESGRIALPLKKLKLVCGGRVPFKQMVGRCRRRAACVFVSLPTDTGKSVVFAAFESARHSGRDGDRCESRRAS
jgi:hypothetical protein